MALLLTAEVARWYLATACAAHARPARELLDALASEVWAVRPALRIEPSAYAPDDWGSVRSDASLTRALRPWTGASDGLPQWPAETNVRFRAVHDCDHLALDSDFSFVGEARAWLRSAQRWPQLAPVLFYEIVGQAAVALAQGAFPPQRVALPPQRILNDTVNLLTGAPT